MLTLEQLHDIRRKVLAGEATEDELREAVLTLRAGRFSAAAPTTRKPAAKKVEPPKDFNKLLGL